MFHDRVDVAQFNRVVVPAIHPICGIWICKFHPLRFPVACGNAFEIWNRVGYGYNSNSVGESLGCKCGPYPASKIPCVINHNPM